MSAGTPIAPLLCMRWFGILLAGSALFLVVGCSAASDGSVTDDANELNEGRGSLERELDPPIAVPTSALIGAKLSDVLAEAKGTATAGAPTKDSDCTTTKYKDATKKVVVEHVACAGSEVVRVLDTEGTTTAEHADLNKDGKVDRYSGEPGAVDAVVQGAVVQLVDTNYDGKIDVVVERVDKVKDFSMNGYEETFPKSAFLHRVREDRNRDGKLDHETLTARGALPKSE